MPRLCLTILLFLSLLSLGAFAVTAPETTDDPYVWLEDVHGAKPLAWVAEQNKKSLARAQGRSRATRKITTACCRFWMRPTAFPSGSLDHGFVYNFWQDAKNPKGIWRRTTIADYANPVPHWEILLDVDALAKAEKENWVFEGAECAPKETAA